MYQERVYHMIQVRQTDRRRESPDRIATNLKALILSRIGAFYFSKVPKNPFPFHFFSHFFIFNPYLLATIVVYRHRYLLALLAIIISYNQLSSLFAVAQ